MTSEFNKITWDETLDDDCRQIVRLAVREDLDRLQDWTTNALVPHYAEGRADVVAREPGTVAGLKAAQAVLEEMAPAVNWKPQLEDGERVEAGAILATIDGPARNLLTCERIVLNFLGRLCGVATLTARYVELVAQTKTQIYDTRKTTPGWRRLEKYAVACGGGCNHRTGLFDAVLIKDNHLAYGVAAEGNQYTPHEAIVQARAYLQQSSMIDSAEGFPVEIEVDTLEQLDQVLPANPDIVLLDNMPPETLREAIARRDAIAAGVVLEASGGVNLQTVGQIAATGVDRISVGALTHSAVALDVGLDWQA